MAGIRAFSTFVPWYRLSRSVLAGTWAAEGSAAGKGVRAVAGFDEDSLTLAVEAAVPLAEAHQAAGGRFSGVTFASASAPYAEKSCASLLAGACNVHYVGLRTTDLAGSGRASLQGLIAAAERLAADPTCAELLVAGAEVRTPPPESDHEDWPGDAAGAVLLSRNDTIAEIVAAHSVGAEMLDVWRVAGDPYLRNADSKFAQSAGFLPAMKEAIGGALAAAGIAAKDVSRYAIGAPSTAAANALLKALEVKDPARLAPLFDGEIGHAGSAQPLLSLAAAMEQATPGQVMVLAAWGDGADAIVLRTTEKIAGYKPPRATAAQIGSGHDLGGYGRYLKARRIAGSDYTAGPEATNVLFSKEQGQNLRLHGAKCRHCGTVQFPLQATCVACRKVGTDPIRLSRAGKVFTFTRDTLNVSPEPITVMSVVDLEGGGRMYLPMTDVVADTVAIGMPVELTFRYYHSGSDFRQYFWKARALRA